MSETQTTATSRADVGGPFEVWWIIGSDEINMTTNNPAITDVDGGKPGLWNTYSSNARSANYNPGNFNRMAFYLKNAGQPAPEPVPVHSRRLSIRNKIIALLKSGSDDTFE